MDNKMIEVKDTFWNKLKQFFQKIISRNKNNLTNSEINSFHEIEEAHKNNEKIDEEKIENIQKTIDEKQNIIEENENIVNNKTEENPQTYDDTFYYIILEILSVITLVSSGFFLKKHIKK